MRSEDADRGQKREVDEHDIDQFVKSADGVFRGGEFFRQDSRESTEHVACLRDEEDYIERGKKKQYHSQDPVRHEAQLGGRLLKFLAQCFFRRNIFLHTSVEQSEKESSDRNAKDKSAERFSECERFEEAVKSDGRFSEMAVDGNKIIEGREEESDDDDKYEKDAKGVTGGLFHFLSGNGRSVGKDDFDGLVRPTEIADDGGDPGENVSERKTDASVRKVCRKQAGSAFGKKMSGSGKHHVDGDDVDEEKTQCLHVTGEGADGKEDQDHFPEDRLFALETVRGEMPEKMLSSDGDLQPQDRAERKACQEDRDRDRAIAVHGK